MVVVLWQNWGEHVGRQLPHFLAGATLTDVTITVGPRSVKAHRIILAFFSPFFKKMLEEVSEERPMVVVFPGVNFHALEVIIAYMYRGQVNVPAELLPSVIELAKMLKVKGLIELPAQLNSVITGKVTETQDIDDPLDINCESEGLVELEVTASDTDHTVSNDSSPGNFEHQITVMTKTGIRSTPDSAIDDEELSEEHSNEQSISANVTTGVKVQKAHVGSNTDDVLIQPEDLQLSIPTHVVKLSDDTAMGEVLFSSDYMPVEGTCEDQSTAEDSVCLQEGQEYSSSKKRRRILYKIARPEDLQRALEDLRAGAGSLKEIAERWGIPHSTLSANARMAGIAVQQKTTDYDYETIEAAKQAVRAGSSYVKVAKEYNIPKSVLWRRCQREEWIRDDHRRSIPYSQEDVRHAQQALLAGRSLSQIIKEVKIPKTTLFRMKEQLVRDGKIPPSSINRFVRQRRPSENSLQQAVIACKDEGMSQGQASEKYQVSKTTVWRRLKKLKEQESSTDALSGSDDCRTKVGQNVKIEVIDDGLCNDRITDAYVGDITMKYAEDGDLRYVESISADSSVKALDYAKVATKYRDSSSGEGNDSARTEDSIHHSVKVKTGKAIVLEEADTVETANNNQSIVISDSQRSSFIKSEHIGIFSGEGHVIHDGETLSITQGAKIIGQHENTSESETTASFELEMPLMNLPSGGYQVVGSEIVIGGQQMVVLEPSGASQDHQTSSDHHHLVVASFSQMDGLDDLSKVERTVSVENLETQTAQLDVTRHDNRDQESPHL